MSKYADNNCIMYNKGFTLVELLVTIAIVGILASFAIAIYNNYKDKAALAEIQFFYHDLVTFVEMIQDDVESANISATNVNYSVQNLVNGTYTVIYNTAGLPNNLIYDFLGAHLDNNTRTRFFISLGYVRYAGDKYYSAGVMSCVTSPNHDNYMYYRRYSIGGTETVIQAQKSFHSDYGRGGSNC